MLSLSINAQQRWNREILAAWRVPSDKDLVLAGGSTHVLSARCGKGYKVTMMLSPILNYLLLTTRIISEGRRLMIVIYRCIWFCCLNFLRSTVVAHFSSILKVHQITLFISGVSDSVSRLGLCFSLFSSSVMSDVLWCCGLQHAKLLCLSPCSQELTQTHAHWVSDAIPPSYPLSLPSPPPFNLSQHQGLF